MSLRLVCRTHGRPAISAAVSVWIALSPLHLAAIAAPVPAPTFDPGWRLHEYLVDRWQTNDGLPQNSINAIAQTPDGYLWFATFDGLVRYDGSSFTTFRAGETPGLSGSRITALATGPDKTLWIGTEGAGIARYRAGRFEPGLESSALASDVISGIHPDPQGGVWLATRDSGLVFARGREVRSFRTGSKPSASTGLASLPNGKLFVGFADGLYELDGGKLVQVPRIPSNTMMVTAAGDDVLAMTQSGLIRVPSGNDRASETSSSVSRTTDGAASGRERRMVWLTSKAPR